MSTDSDVAFRQPDTDGSDTAAWPGRGALLDGRLRPAGRSALVWAFVLVLGLMVFGPLVELQSQALANGGRGYERAFGASNIGEVILTTVWLALGALAIALVLGTMLAWWAERLPPRLRWLRILPVLPIVVPAIASVVGWSFLLSPGPGYINTALRKLPWWSGLDQGPIDVYTVPWIVFVVGIGLSAFIYLFVSSGLANVNGELMEAAYVHGSSASATFFKVVLPLLRPSLIYGAGVGLLMALGQFTAPLLLGTNQGVDVLTTAIFQKVNGFRVDQAGAAALGSPLLVFGLLVVIGQKLALGNQRRFVTHGGKGGFRSLARPSYGAALGIMLYFVLSTLLPVLALISVALSPYWSGRIEPSVFTFHNISTVLSTDGVLDAIRNSVVFSAVAVLIALPVGFVAATILLRGSQRGGRVARVLLDLIVSSPLGIPAVLFGVGFLLVYTQPPLVLYGTSWIIILVYVTLMLPFATRMQMSAIMALGTSYEEASRTSGAGLLRTKVRIVFPLLRPAIGASSALMFVLLTHEFTASVLVRTPFQQVMGTVLFDNWQNGAYPTVASIALIMSFVTAAGVAVATFIGGSDALRRL
ncbi:binding-protein-dependent transport systems inner membrane component [Parafrankia sp. EAN1pec]|uniref:ABC transporter permease n=1 Tax=Parafrankia sp. (strain EAN1pec) TaxID=298653 RepID=UPI00015D9EA0|nr:binding-protein-dependent transport systems inner membrane component [Frankia sp. EAN1pec]